ncbi:MAG TPA: lactonase family protein [Candidatus Acidoferrum sp.]|nr:lactonase family protein [Candidatus Acidoferrum sp.]
MKITRRIFTFSLLIAPLVFSVAGESADKPAANRKYLVFVGTYTHKTESKGIYGYEFDADTGKLTPKGVAVETLDPSWIAVHPSGKFVYAANEAGKASTVSAFVVDGKSGKLTLLNQKPALGEDPCYLSFDKTGKYILVANYSSGTIAVFPILADGRLGEHTALVKDQGATGPNKKRQEAPHAHWIETTAHNHFVYVADLGLDRVLIYKFDATKGSLTPGEPLPSKATPDKEAPLDPFSVTLNPGAGPRHVAFARDGKFMYVLGELQSTVTVFANEAQETYRSVQQISTLPKGFAGRNDAAEIAVHPNGKFLYASNRGHDSIAIFAIDPAKGTLTFISHVLTGGKEPRHFAIDPSGKYLLAENQFSNNVVVFKIDPATGGLTPTGQVVEVPSPVDIAFLQED